MRKLCWLLAMVCFIHSSVKGDLYIESFETGGQLTFAEIDNAVRYWVEWAPAPGGPWTNFTGDAATLLNHIDPSGEGSLTVAVPISDAEASAMFYRVFAEALSPPQNFDVYNSGSSSYLIDDASNPTLQLVRGLTYTFTLKSPGHPFWIKTLPKTGTGDAFNQGVSTNGVAVGTIVFTVPLNAPDTLYYICQFHSAMQGVIEILDVPPPPAGMVTIPAGTNSGTDPDFGNYSLTVDVFYMDRYPVTKDLWDEVYIWATHADRGANVYSFENRHDELQPGRGKATNHPVHTVSWYDAVKWCNARSEMEGRPPVYRVNGGVYRTGQVDHVTQTTATGYRLPTDTEWSYAARGGTADRRFPWGHSDSIDHTRANYVRSTFVWYDVAETAGAHPDYNDGIHPYTSPVGAFPANGYGLYDMAGNVLEWVFDWDPLFVNEFRYSRGGSWFFGPENARIGTGVGTTPETAGNVTGFRTVLSPN